MTGYNRNYSDQSSRPKTNVYTDGASSNNGKSGARAGYGVFFDHNDPRNVSEPLQGPRQTNQRAELTAIRTALERTDGDVVIHTDSKYSIESVTNWSRNWENNGWKTSSGKPVQNQDLIQDILDLARNRNGTVEYNHVKGHSGHPGNDAADFLATQGAKMHDN
ncbi:hypothetical protein FBU59_000011 [Linderina macrospora]|uniref:Uncharacterized protein n=1 Tax=Linderina macrospora TaxID=4868 RepID=A0ACC1JI60_9FUNG|nr:hypothetical protein FBU59_000011 [Linderina macrospora]